MSENSSTPTRTPAHELLLAFLKEKDISFLVRRQDVRFLEDNGIIIDPPKIIVFYNDEIKDGKKAPTPPQPDKVKLDLPPEKK